jgi:bifunctional DNase/RNase
MSMLEMTIDSIRVSMMNYQHVVILREKDSDRYLPIWIGPSEADAISVKLQNIHLSRPLTHDLLKNTIFALESLSGTSISKVVVNDLKADTFYAQIIFDLNDGPTPISVNLPANRENGGMDKDSQVTLIWNNKKYETKVMGETEEEKAKHVELIYNDGLIFELYNDKEHDQWLLINIKLDSRPSDAIALAVRATTPIFVDESVLDKAGIILDKDTGKPLPLHKEGSDKKSGKVADDELSKLKDSAFYDFINSLDLDDLGKRKS